LTKKLSLRRVCRGYKPSVRGLLQGFALRNDGRLLRFARNDETLR
jgi:hypothetical protein